MTRPDGEDFVRYLMTVVRHQVPDISEEQASNVECQVRHDYGGERPYIAKMDPARRERRRQAVAQAGDTSKAAIAKAQGVSRRTIYNWLKKTDDNNTTGER